MVANQLFLQLVFEKVASVRNTLWKHSYLVFLPGWPPIPHTLQQGSHILLMSQPSMLIKQINKWKKTENKKVWKVHHKQQLHGIIKQYILQDESEEIHKLMHGVLKCTVSLKLWMNMTVFINSRCVHWGRNNGPWGGHLVCLWSPSFGTLSCVHGLTRGVSGKTITTKEAGQGGSLTRNTAIMYLELSGEDAGMEAAVYMTWNVLVSWFFFLL